MEKLSVAVVVAALATLIPPKQQKSIGWDECLRPKITDIGTMRIISTAEKRVYMRCIEELNGFLTIHERVLLWLTQGALKPETETL